jgi:hypothetical protein
LSFKVPKMENSSPQKLISLNTFLKWGLIGFLGAILVIAIVLSTNLDEAKNTLIAKVSAETGMKIDIESIGFGFAHGLGLKCSGVNIVTPDGETYAVEQLHLLAQWGPLFAGKFKIDSAALDSPKLTLILPDSTEKKTESDKKVLEETKPFSSPVQSAQKKLKETQLSVRNLKISDGQITLMHPKNQKTLLANVDLNLQLDQVSSDKLNVLVDALKISTGEISLEGNAKGENLTAQNGNLSFELETSSFGLDDLKPVLAFFSQQKVLKNINALEIKNLALSGKAPLEALKKPEKLLQQSGGKINFNITKVAFAGTNPLQIEPLEGTAKWSDGVLQPDIKATALGSEFGLKGKITTKKINTETYWKELNITQLPLPASNSWSPIAGVVSGTLNLDGPLPEPEKPLPVKLKGKLNFQFKDLVLANKLEKISLPKLEGSSDYKSNQLDYQLLGNIFAGNFKSNGKVKDLKHPNIDSQLEYSNLDLSQFTMLKPGIGIPTQGKASGTLKLKGPLPENGNLHNLAVQTSFDIASLSLPMVLNKKTFPLEIPSLKGTADLNENKLTHNVNANLLGGSVGVTGNLKIGSKKSAHTTIKIKTIDLSSLDQFIPSASGSISADVKLKGHLPENGKIPSNLKVDTNFDLENLRIPLEVTGKMVTAEISKIKGTVSLNRNKLDHNITAKLLGGNVSAKGNLLLKDSGTPRTVDTAIGLEHLDLVLVQRLKKGDWVPTSGKLTGNLKVKGPIPEGKDSPIKIKATGTLTASALALGTGEKKNAIGTAKLTLKDSSKDFIQALIELDRFQTAGLEFKKIQTNFKINPKQIDLIEGRVFPKNGQLKLKGAFKPPSGAYRIQFKGDKLKVEDFAKQMAGPLNLQGKLNGKLPEKSTGFPDIAKELSGQVKLYLRDGMLPELKAVDALLTILNPTSALQTSKAGLNYESVGGDFKIVKGLVNTDNFEMKSSQINLQVVGEADLGADTVKAQVKAMPLQMLDKTIKAIPLLGQILSGGKKGGIIATYFKVDGKLSAPSVTAQPHKSLTEKTGAILNELINMNLTGDSK